MNESLTGRKLELYGMVEEIIIHNGCNEDCLEECREQIKGNEWDNLLTFIQLIVIDIKDYYNIINYIKYNGLINEKDGCDTCDMEYSI